VNFTGTKTIEEIDSPECPACLTQADPAATAPTKRKAANKSSKTSRQENGLLMPGLDLSPPGPVSLALLDRRKTRKGWAKKLKSTSGAGAMFTMTDTTGRKNPTYIMVFRVITNYGVVVAWC
jgi:hypothetical protein